MHQQASNESIWSPMKRAIVYLIIGIVAMIGYGLGRKTQYEADSVALVNNSGVDAIIEYEDAKHPDIVEKHFEPIILRDTVEVIVRDTVIVQTRVEVPVIQTVIKRDTVFVRNGLSSDQLTSASSATAKTAAGYLQKRYNAGCFDAFFRSRTYSNSSDEYVEIQSPTRHHRSSCSFERFLDKSSRKDAMEFSEQLISFIKSGKQGIAFSFLMSGGEIIVTYGYESSFRLTRAHVTNKYEPIQ